MMTEPPIAELLDKVDCLYTLAVESAKRARQLVDDPNRRMFDSKENNPLSIAIEEINRKLVTYSRDEDGEDTNQNI